jgi:hypothetical protein
MVVIIIILILLCSVVLNLYITVVTCFSEKFIHQIEYCGSFTRVSFGIQ